MARSDLRCGAPGAISPTADAQAVSGVRWGACMASSIDRHCMLEPPCAAVPCDASWSPATEQSRLCVPGSSEAQVGGDGGFRFVSEKRLRVDRPWVRQTRIRFVTLGARLLTQAWSGPRHDRVGPALCFRPLANTVSRARFRRGGHDEICFPFFSQLL